MQMQETEDEVKEMTYHYYYECDGCKKQVGEEGKEFPLTLHDSIRESKDYHFHNYRCLAKWLLEKKARYIEDKKGLVSFPTSFGRVSFKKTQ